MLKIAEVSHHLQTGSHSKCIDAVESITRDYFKNKSKLISLCTYNVDELTEPKSHLDREPIRVVANGSDQAIVVGKQVVIQPLRIRVCVAQAAPHAQHSDHQRQHHLRLTPPLEQ